MNDLSVRDVSALDNRLANTMRQSPTGNQMTIDGSLVVALYDDDPAESILNPPNGTLVLWLTNNHLVLLAFTRDSGWQSLPFDYSRSYRGSGGGTAGGAAVTAHTP